MLATRRSIDDLDNFNISESMFNGLDEGWTDLSVCQG